MTPLEKMREKQRKLHESMSAAPQLSEAVQPPAAQPAVPSKPKPKPTPPKPVATVKHKCGHEQPLAYLQGQWCPACRNENKRRKAAERREKAPGSDSRRYKMPNAQRLPNGATFHATYDAEKMEWSGTLCINDQVFTSAVSGVFNLMRDLDQQYRTTLAP